MAFLPPLWGGETKGGLRESGHAANPANPPSAQSYGWQPESARRGKPISTFASPRAARNKRACDPPPLGRHLRRPAPFRCARVRTLVLYGLASTLRESTAALYDSRLRRLLAKFAAHPQRMHLCEIGIESRISRGRGKFNGANSTHYILCTDDAHGMLCLLSSDADGETEPFTPPEHFAHCRPLLVLNPTPNYPLSFFA